MTKIYLFFFLIFSSVFIVSSHAQTVPVAAGPADPMVGDVIEQMVRHAMDGNWKMFFAFVIILAMIGLKTMMKRHEKTWNKRIGSICLLVIAFGTMISTAILGGVAISVNLLIGAFGTAIMASGGYNLFKDIFFKEKKNEGPPPSPVS